MSNMKTVVVIGSGNGALITGAFLAQAGAKVVVVEQHDRVGGYAHNFGRKNYRFESGIHTAALAEGGVVRTVLGQLGINDEIKTFEYPEMYRTISPYGTEIMPSNKDDVIAKLYDDYGHQKKGLDIYFSDLDLLYDEVFTLWDKGKRGLLDEDHTKTDKFRRHSYGSYLEQIFDDEKLRFFLSGMWMYIGITPGFGEHMFMQMLFNSHFRNGTHGVVGGFSSIPKALAKFIEKTGGKIILEDKIERILCENRVVKCVKTKNGLSIDCDLVVSGCSPYSLHHNLLDENSRSSVYQTRLSRLKPADPAVIVYLGMKKGYEKYIDCYVGMYSRHKDIDAPYKRLRGENSAFECDNLAIMHGIQFMADPTILMFSFVKQTDSRNWKNDKKIVADKMIDELNAVYPGIKEYIDLVEIGSPDTCERYTLSTGGSIYGFQSPGIHYHEAKMPITTHIKNLYQVGQWIRPGCGIFSTTASGYTAAQMILEKNKF